MNQTYYENFDLRALLLLSGLNVRHYAEANPSLTVDGYFSVPEPPSAGTATPGLGVPQAPRTMITAKMIAACFSFILILLVL